MSNIKYLAYLKTVEFQSLTKAANFLGYTQPGISHMITSLEQELGFPLLIRAKDGVYPTDEGQQLLYYMRQIVNNETMLKDLANQINGIETGSIRIGVFSSTSTQWMPGLLQKFTALHPNIRVQIIEGTTIELQNLFSENYLDLGLMSDPAPEGFEFIPLMQDPILAIIPRDHPLADKESIAPAELVKYPFIVPQVGADEDIWRVLNPEKLIPEIRYRIKGDHYTGHGCQRIGSKPFSGTGYSSDQSKNTDKTSDYRLYQNLRSGHPLQQICLSCSKRISGAHT